MQGMTAFFTAAMLVCGLVFQSCKSPAEATASAPDVPAMNIDSLPEAPFELLDATIVDDSLIVSVQYGGGCGDHAFELRQKGPMMKSLPPKQMLEVVHRTVGDPCRALIRQRQAFDLKPWRGTPRGVTVILLENWKEPLNYEYD